MSRGHGLDSDKNIAKSQGLEVGSLIRSDKGSPWIILDALLDYHLLDRKSIRKNTRRGKPSDQKTSACKVHLKVELATLIAEPACLPKPEAAESGNVAVLVCKVFRGRLPEAKVEGAVLCVRVGNAANAGIERNFLKTDETWKSFVDLTEAVVNTIEVLVREGFSASRIAEVLKQPEPLINKVMAHCLGFNVDLPQHACLLVHADSLPNGFIELEVKRKGRIEAATRIPLKEVVLGKHGNMNVRRLVSLTPAGSSSSYLRRTPTDKTEKKERSGQSGNRFDLDVELQLFAFKMKRQDAAEPQGMCTPAKDSVQPIVVTM